MSCRRTLTSCAPTLLTTGGCCTTPGFAWRVTICSTQTRGPKIGHLSRRWHGHPVFPAMLELGGVLECRSNWKIYVLNEFCFAVERLTAVRRLAIRYRKSR